MPSVSTPEDSSTWDVPPSSPLLAWSPLSALPSELLNLVFEHCSAGDPDVCTPVPKSLAAPMILSQVCLRWRTLALGSKHLWRAFRIVIKETNFFVVKRPHIVAQLERWLDRSKDALLFVTVQYEGVYESQSDNETLRALREVRGLALDVISLLRSHAKRWREVEYRCPSPLLSSLLNSDGPLQCARLNKFRFMGSLQGTFSHNTPNFAVESLSLPYHSLTTLVMWPEERYCYVLSLDAGLAILSRCPRLLSCTLAICCTSESRVGGQYRPTCRLSHLRLEVRDERADAGGSPMQTLAQFLAAIELGSLIQLSINWTSWSSAMPLPGPEEYRPILSVPFSRCRKLKNVKLRCLPLNTSDLIACVKALDGLKSLELGYLHKEDSYNPVTQGFFQELGCRTSLRKLRVSGHAAAFGENDLRRFVEQHMGRNEITCGLKEVVIRWDKELSKEWRQWEHGLYVVRPGLTLRVKKV